MDTFKHELQDFSVYPNGQTAYEHTYQTRQCGYVTCEDKLYIQKCGRVTYENTLHTQQCGRVTYEYTLHNPTMFPPIRFEHRNQHARYIPSSRRHLV